MSILTKKDVSKVASLSRISDGLSEEELEKYLQELEAVLQYATELNEVDVTGINPLDGIRTCTITDLREDEADSSDDKKRVRKNIIANFPKSQGDLLIVPGVFDES